MCNHYDKSIVVSEGLIFDATHLYQGKPISESCVIWDDQSIWNAAYLNLLISSQAVKSMIEMVISYNGDNTYMEQIL